jgi:anti-sigma factor RsiW
MNLNPDSPEITAYALGELPAAEMEAVAALVASDPSLQAEVEAIQACARSLEAELAAEPAAALSDSQRSEIEDAAGRWAEETPAEVEEEHPVRQATGAWWRWLLQPQWGLGLAGTAAVVLALGVRVAVQVMPPSPLVRLESEPLGTVTSAAVNPVTASVKVNVTLLVSPICNAVSDRVMDDAKLGRTTSTA